MSKYVKGLFQDELKNKFSEVDDFLVISTKGLNGNDNNAMRGFLKSKGIKLSVVKNSAMRNALEGLGKSAAVSLFLAGACTVAYGGDSVVDVAREVVEWAKSNGVEVISLNGAFVDGEVLGADSAKSLSTMPNRAELHGRIVMLVQSPGATVAGAIAGPGGLIAGCIKSLIEKLKEAA